MPFRIFNCYMHITDKKKNMNRLEKKGFFFSFNQVVMIKNIYIPILLNIVELKKSLFIINQQLHFSKFFF